MRTKIFFMLGVFIIFGFISNTNDSELLIARDYYQKGKDDSKAAENLKTFTETKTSKPIFKAYNGVSYLLMAKHHWNPYRKMEYVNKGLEIINQAIIANPTEIESRFLRFTVEENLPTIISFTSHIQADKTYILANLKATHSFYTTMKGYLKTSKTLTEAEKKKL